MTAFENARIGKGAGIFHSARLDERTSAMDGDLLVDASYRTHGMKKGVEKRGETKGA